MKHKSIAYLLSFILLFQTFMFGVQSVYAVENDSADSPAVRLLTALNIMDTDEYTGNFWDNVPVKRSVMAQIICKLFAYDAVADQTAKFIDVNETDRAYVETVVRNGHMNGYDDEEFGPDDFVTGEQLVKIFVCLLYADGYAEHLGGFPAGYIKAGKELGIIKGSFQAGETAAKRIDVANIIYNTLNAEILQMTGIEGVNFKYNTRKGETFLTEKLGIYQNSGIMKKNEATTLSRPVGLGDGMVEIGDVVYRDKQRLTDGYFGCNVNVFVKKTREDDMGDVIYIEEADKNEMIEVSGEDVTVNPNTDREIAYYTGSKTKTLNISLTADMIYNGKSITLDMSRIKDENCFVKFIDNDDNNEVDVIIVDVYDTFVVDKVNVDDEKLLFKYGEKSIDLKNGFVTIMRDGVEASLGEIGVGEVLLIAISDGTDDKVFKVNVSSDVAIGSIEKKMTVDGDVEKCVINGEEHTIGSYVKELIANGKLSALKPGLTGRFYLDAYGTLVYYSLDAPGERVGYLIASNLKNEGLSSQLTVRVYTTDKTIETYVADDYLTINGVRREVAAIDGNVQICEQLATPQLIKYRADGDKIKKIVFALDGYDANEFSLDIDRTLTCTNTSILDDKYLVSAETVVFYVPSPSGTTYDSVKFETGKYHLFTGSYFSLDGSYQVKIYDIADDGFVNYAVISRDYRWSNIGEGEPWFAVTSVGDKVASNGEIVKAVTGYNEAGKEVQFEIADDDTLNGSVMTVDTDKGLLTDTGVDRMVAVGDLIQYHTDSQSKIDEIRIVLKPGSDTAYFTPVPMTDSTNCKTDVVYGEAVKVYSDHLLLGCKTATQDMTPLDADKYVSDNGSAVYEFDSENQCFYPFDFADLEIGDRVFACVSGANKTRILIVYR